MRYIQLQRILQQKMSELEKLCVKERQLLEGKWKTHSLPARKKSSNQNVTNTDPATPTQVTYSYCRPTVSTEDVAKVQRKTSTPPALIFAYQYLDPHYRYMLQPSTSSSGEYLLSFEPPRYKGDQHHFIVKTPCEPQQQQQQQQQGKSHKGNQTNGTSSKSKKSHDSCHGYGGHLCNPCIRPNNNADNTSLDAYDLASPCCDPHCVPTNRRRTRNNHKEHHRKRDSKTEETQTDPPPQQQQQTRHHTQTQTHQTSSSSAPRRYLQLGAGLVSQCSLHSCTSSEMSNIVQQQQQQGGESSASYTTSLSTDTLYWDGSCDLSSRTTVSVKSSKQEHHQQYVPVTTYIQYNPIKPKSWDNLATKAFGGYGFGYGYLDTSQKCSSKTHNRSQSTKTGHCNRNSEKYAIQTVSVYTPHTQRRYIQTTKSSESLLSLPKYSNETLSDSSCECLDNDPSPGPDSKERFFQSPRQSVVSPTDPNFGYYSARKTKEQRIVTTTSSEATRL